MKTIFSKCAPTIIALIAQGATAPAIQEVALLSQITLTWYLWQRIAA